MIKNKPTSFPHGFTLIELLTVIVVIGILSTLLATGLSSAHNRARRTACQNNLKQLIYGALMYADDDKNGTLSTAVHDTNDVVAYLFPKFVPATRTFICPATKNFIRPSITVTNPITQEIDLYDLTAYAGNTRGPGTSYELFGFMNYTSDTPNFTDLAIGNSIIRVRGVRKTTAEVQSYHHYYDSFGLKNVAPGPSQICLILDGDEPPGHQNYPDENNNHGAIGGNMSFCDGHVEWIPTGKYVFRYELSQDENRSTP